MAREYSLTDTLEQLLQNQLAFKAAVMELTHWAEQQNVIELGMNARGALHSVGENAGHSKQVLARLRGS